MKALIARIVLSGVVIVGAFSILRAQVSVVGVPAQGAAPVSVQPSSAVNGAGVLLPSLAQVGGTLFSSMTATSTTGLVEETLLSYTMPGNTLSVNTRGVRITTWGSFAANANNKTIKVYFGATNISFVGPAAFNGVAWSSVNYVGRITATTQTANGGGVQNALGWTQSVTAPAETLSGAVLIKVTGTTPTTIADATANGLTVEIF